MEQYYVPRTVKTDTGEKGPQILDKSLWEKPVTGTSYRETCSPPRVKSVITPLANEIAPGHIPIYKQGVQGIAVTFHCGTW